MAHKNEINVLSDLLNKEKLDPCNVLADNDYLTVIEDAIYLNFSIDFDHWYDELINQ